MKKQLHSGYILSSIKESLSKLDSPIEFSSLLSQLSCFEIEYNFKENPVSDSIVTVLDNLISRGLPTLPSIYIEDLFSEIFRITEKEVNRKTGEILYNETLILKENIELIYSSFYVIDPRINNDIKPNFNFQTWEDHPGSEYEEDFFNSILSKTFNESLRQLIEPQRLIQSILKNSERNEDALRAWLGGLQNDFFRQRVDFCFEFPKAEDYSNGMVIEIDGSQHKYEPQKMLDKKRDEVISRIGWAPTTRICTDELSSIPDDKIQQINHFIKHPYYQQIKENYEHPIWHQEFGLEAMQIALSPIAIARIQKSIIFLVSSGVLKFEADSWHIAVIERDVPCAFLAIEDLMQLFSNLFWLEGKGMSLPRIKLSIFYTEEFKSCQLNDGLETFPIENFKSQSSYDAILDISVLQRYGFNYPQHIDFSKYDNYIKIRSSHSQKEDRFIKSAEPIKYVIPEEKQPEPLVYFLRNIFRKIEFREGQVEILRKTLSLQNVIALLPTGAGKSLTYQLSVLLQPGICLIVDPLKSLMRDQNDNLKAAGIDSTTFINSSITARERKERSNAMLKGKYQFVFISPERLQIAEFREFLEMMTETYFTYCIVDEAHCVSEWGHDFRTAYLRLGKNARKYCKTLVKQKNDEGREEYRVPIIGLTGTASFDVLADVQRELEIADESAIVAPSKYEREELNFKIIDVGEVDIPVDSNEPKIKDLVAEEKLDALYNLLRNEIPKLDWEGNSNYESLESFFSRNLKYKNSGIIFCPHKSKPSPDKSKISKFGVYHIHSSLSQKFVNLAQYMDMFAGSSDDDWKNQKDNEEEKNIITQNRFKRDEIALLIATKAFGMGIDKPNIRFTVHFNMPQSIESFYQEAGRAGRDRENAYCFILYSPTKLKWENEEEITVDKSLMLSFYYNSFRGIEKEKRIMWELLNEITFPKQTLNVKLQEIINGFDYPIRFYLWPKDFPTRLYINGEEFPKSYGYIALNDLAIHPETRNERIIVPQDKAKQILLKITNLLHEKCPQNVSLQNWLTQTETVEPQPGFERLLSNMGIGETKRVMVGFTNDRIQKIVDYLSVTNQRWNEQIVTKANNYCFTSENFINKLKKEFWQPPKQNYNFSEKQKKQISTWFKQIRDELDTFKAIYRLSVIGLVHEYEVDYNSKNIIATIIKKPDDYYIKSLQDYIGRYVSVEEKLREPEKILASKGDTVIQKCCGRLAEFVYSKIAAKRLEAIDMMERALNEENFEEFVNTYFDSRYTPELRKYLYDYSIDIVWKLIKESEGNPDSINHLRGACNRLLVDNPDNPAFLLLRAFSGFLIPSYNKKDALSDFKKGWRLFRDLKNWTRKEYLKYLSKFYALTTNYDSSIKIYLDPIILNEHRKWLKEFNQKFLEEVQNV